MPTMGSHQPSVLGWLFNALSNPENRWDLQLPAPPRDLIFCPEQPLGHGQQKGITGAGDVPGCAPGTTRMGFDTFHGASPPHRARRRQARIHSNIGPGGHEPVGDIWGPQWEQMPCMGRSKVFLTRRFSCSDGNNMFLRILGGH